MENASRALIIAGSVLISLLVIGTLVFMFTQLSDLRQTQEDASMEDELQSFFSTLNTYIDDNKRGSDILSLANLIDDFNERRAGQNEAKYGNEGYDPITLEVYYDVSKFQSSKYKSEFFKNNKDGHFTSAQDITKAKNNIDKKVDELAKKTIPGVSGYTVKQLASMRYQELMVLTSNNDELLQTIQNASEEYNFYVAEQKDIKSTVRFNYPDATYNNVSGRVTKLVYTQK